MSKKMIGGFLKNKTAAYLFLFLSLIEVYALLIQKDIKTLFVFIFTCVITSYYYKDMSIILICGLVLSNIYKTFTYKEGFVHEGPEDTVFRTAIDNVEDLGIIQECGLEAFENIDKENDDDNEEEDDDVNIEELDGLNDIKQTSVEDTAKLANAQRKLIQNLKDMQPIIKEIEGFSSSSANISDDTINKLIKALDKQQNNTSSNN